MKMKRIALVLVLVALLVGCETDPEWKNPDNQERLSSVGTVYRYIDAEAGVVCWIVDGGYNGGMSCLPIGETDLRIGERE